MRIWVDLNNSPHVPFFRALVNEFEKRGHEVELTARRFAQTVELAHAAGFRPAIIGEHGGRKLASKGQKLVARALALARWTRGRRFDLAVSHNAHEHILAARLLGLRSVTLMDYEHNPANHLSFRLASRVIVPDSFPAESLRRFGARESKVRRYRGIKEDVYLADFEPDPHFGARLKQLFDIDAERDILVVVRPPAQEALYHRFENALFDELLHALGRRTDVRALVLARTEAQRAHLAARHRQSNLFMPREALDGANLIAASDLVVSAGGTMNREAAALGVPVATVYAGRWAAVDEQLVREGRLQRISNSAELGALRLEKKSERAPRRALGVRREVAGLILE